MLKKRAISAKSFVKNTRIKEMIVSSRLLNEISLSLPWKMLREENGENTY